MGEVYRALDTRLGREVALKVLPAAVVNDSERLTRFQREAQVLASLNHPNIAAIYGLEESGGVRALVMELVEGPTLAERIMSGSVRTGDTPARESSKSIGGPGRAQLPMDECLQIAKQIAEALEYAHEKGVMHRDLKPANVKITPEGMVKVLDFGLAKAFDPGGAAINIGNSPTLTGAATQTGVILGTAAYMSPEQARGKKVDKRADIWAFGAVLHELLTGKQLFGGEALSDTLAAVLTKDPDWGTLPAGTPSRIRQLLHRCLTKDPKQRLRDIGEARIAIEETLGGAEARPEDAVADEPSRPRFLQRRLTNWIVAVILLCLGGVVGIWIGSRRLRSPLRWSGELLGGSNVAFGPRVSPDGHTIAFQAMVDDLTQVAVLNPESGNWTVRTRDRSHGVVNAIAWSRDGSKIYFDRIASRTGTGIYTVPSLGGEERLVLEGAESPMPLPDGSLLVTRLDPDRRRQIYHYWPDSGRFQALGALFLPGTTFTNQSNWQIFRDGREVAVVGTISGNVSNGSLHVYTLDIATGKPRQLVPQLIIPQPPAALPLAITPDDRSILIDLPSGNLHQIVAIPRSGSGPVQSLLSVTRAPWWMDAGPDGSLYLDQVDRPLELLRFPVSGGAPEVIASSEAYPPEYMQPVEFPDGRVVLPALLSDRARLLIGKPRGNFFPLVETAEETRPPAALFSPSEVALIAGAGSEKTIAIVSVREGRVVRRLQGTKGNYVTSLAASADGKTLYYTSSGSAWAIPTADGTPRKICSGDSVAVEPNQQGLVVNLEEASGVRLVRVPLSGGPAHDIRVQGNFPISPFPLAGSAVREDGKILIGVQVAESWFTGLGIVDPATGKLTRVPLNYKADISTPGWASDGNILAFGLPMRARIWRFRPMP
jgi:serine/threonine protein kinase